MWWTGREGPDSSQKEHGMEAVVWHDVGKVSVDEVPDPAIQDPADAIVCITTSAICGTDLHFVRGTMPGMRPGTILGHEGVGVVEQAGPEVRNFCPGDCVVIPSTSTAVLRVLPGRLLRASSGRPRRAPARRMPSGCPVT